MAKPAQGMSTEAPATETAKSDVDLDTFLRMADVSTALRKQREEVTKQLNIKEEKDDLVQRLLKTAEASGETLTEADARASVDQHYAGLHKFKAPKRGIYFAHTKDLLNQGYSPKGIPSPLRNTPRKSKRYHLRKLKIFHPPRNTAAGTPQEIPLRGEAKNTHPQEAHTKINKKPRTKS